MEPSNPTVLSLDVYFMGVEYHPLNIKERGSHNYIYIISWLFIRSRVAHERVGELGHYSLKLMAGCLVNAKLLDSLLQTGPLRKLFCESLMIIYFFYQNIILIWN